MEVQIKKKLSRGKESQRYQRRVGHRTEVEHEYAEFPISGEPAENPQPPIIDPTKDGIIEKVLSLVSRKRCMVIIGVVLLLLILVITVVLLYHFKVIGPNVTTEGIWSKWGGWSTCRSTCGPGTHVRNRTCSTENCVGIEIQQDMCVEEACPRLDHTPGVWTTWEAWGNCGKTCGNSTQTRTRSCQLTHGQAQCLGNATQTRSCNNGICPDCKIECSGGNFRCIACECEGNTVVGRVLTVEGVPIPYVQISHANYRHTPLEITNSDGDFTLNSVCIGSSLLFSKEEYLDVVVTINTTDNTVRLTKYEPLRMTQEPNSRSLLTGDCVRLICIADGSPGPAYYEWFQDAMLVTSHDGSKELLIQGITQAESGSYRCRASNDYSAVFSRTVTLTVEGSIDEICDSVPRSHVINVPYGCEVNGSREVDIGTCSKIRCALEKDASCTSNVSSRCDVIQYDRQIRQCDGYQIPLDIAVTCGCLLHYEPTKVLAGVVLDSADETPILFAQVKIGETASLTDARGIFSVDLPDGIVRLSVAIIHPTYNELDMVLMVSEDINHYHRTVHLTRKAPPVMINAAGESSIMITSNITSTVYSAIHIPANSFVTEEGDIHADGALVFVENYDPRDTFTVQDAPGDFTAIDIEGRTQYLLSGGMARMKFTDVSGNKLYVQNNISMSLKLNLTGSEIYEAATGMKLWKLDSQNRWRFLSDVTTDSEPNRRKRQITDRDPDNLELYVNDIPGIDVTNKWVNFDYVWKSVCLTKVKVFEDNVSNREITNARVQVVTLMGNYSEINTVSEIRPSENALSGQCIAHPCDTGGRANVNYRGYIIARDVDGEFLKPAIKQDLTETFNLGVKKGSFIVTDLNSQRTNNGPFYNTDYFTWPIMFGSLCTNAPNTDNAFKFFKYSQSQCIDKALPLKRITSEQIVGNDLNARKHFYSSKLDIGQLNACFMRIRISEAIQKDAILTANNYIQHKEPKTENWYGLRQKCVASEFTCIEYKAPGAVYHATSGGWKEESTQVVIFLTNRTDVKATLNSLLDDDNNTDDHAATVHVKEEVSAHEKGLFCESVDFDGLKEEQTTITQAMDLALKECEKTTNEMSWAVSFT